MASVTGCVLKHTLAPPPPPPPLPPPLGDRFSSIQSFVEAVEEDAAVATKEALAMEEKPLQMHEGAGDDYLPSLTSMDPQ